MKSVIYVLLLNNGQYYVGSTNNPNRRLHEHNIGYCKSTKHKLPYSLVFCQEFDTIKEAGQAEYKIKKQKSRQIIEKIITTKSFLSKLLGAGS